MQESSNPNHKKVKGYCEELHAEACKHNRLQRDRNRKNKKTFNGKLERIRREHGRTENLAEHREKLYFKKYTTLCTYRMCM